MSSADRISVLIADDVVDTHENLKKLLFFESDIEVVGTATDGQQAVDMVKRLQPDVVLMDINMPGLDGITATEAIQGLRLHSQVIMMSVQAETDYLRRSMLAGAREFLIKPFSGDELSGSIRRVNQLRREHLASDVVSQPNPTTAEGEPRGKIISVFSPKGGVGRTTLICNLAVALRETTGKKVALVDCNLQFGDVGVLLNLHSSKTIVDLFTRLDSLDSDLLDDILATHSSGVRTLLAPPRPEMAELVSGDAVKTILAKLQENYDYVLVDTSPSFQETMLAVLDVSDRILVVLTLELPAIKNVKLFLEVASALGYPRTKTLLVLNRADSTGGIKMSDVEVNLKMPIAASIVSDGRVATYALNQGVPFVLASRNSQITRCVVDLAKFLDGRELYEPPLAQQQLTVPAKRNHDRLSGRLSFLRQRERLGFSIGNR